MAGRSINTEMFMNHLRCDKSAYLLANEERLDPLKTSPISLEIEGYKNFIFSLICNEEWHENTDIIQNKLFVTSDDETAVADAIITRNNKNILIKIKHSTEKADGNDLYELAYISYVIEKTGMKIHEYWVCSTNSSYVFHDYVEKEIIRVECSFNKVEARLKTIPSLIKHLKINISKRTIPEKNVGWYCERPNQCVFKKFCYDALPFSDSIFDLGETNKSNQMRLHFKGITDVRDIPSDEKLTQKQWNEIKSVLSKKPQIDVESLKSFLTKFFNSQSIWYLSIDYKTTSLPFLSRSKPFFKVPFQYSLHNENRKTNNISHFSEINDDPLNPINFRHFAAKLVKDLSYDPGALIIIYNKNRISELLCNISEVFPEYKEELRLISNRMLDLKEIFKNRWYFDPKFKGSSRIKDILPVLCPSLKTELLHSLNLPNYKNKHFFSMSKTSPHKKELQEVNKIYSTGLRMITSFLIEIIKKSSVRKKR